MKTTQVTSDITSPPRAANGSQGSGQPSVWIGNIATRPRMALDFVVVRGQPPRRSVSWIFVRSHPGCLKISVWKPSQSPRQNQLRQQQPRERPVPLPVAIAACELPPRPALQVLQYLDVFLGETLHTSVAGQLGELHVHSHIRWYIRG